MISQTMIVNQILSKIPQIEIDSVSYATRIREYLFEMKTPMKAKAIGENLGINYGTVRRNLNELFALGYVSKRTGREKPNGRKGYVCNGWNMRRYTSDLPRA